MKFLRLAAVLCVAITAAACLPVTTKTPVGSTAWLGADKSLYGTWLGSDEKGSPPAYFHFLDAKDGGMTVIVVSSPKGEDKGDWSVYAIKTSTLGEHHFLNATVVSNNGDKPGADEAIGMFPILYRTGKDGSVTLYLMDDKAAAAAIKAGKIAGQVEPGDSGDVHITADAAATDAFMQSADGLALFQKPLVILRRVK